MIDLFVVGIGGFFGAIARYATSLAVAVVWPGRPPIATFLVNVAGSFALGFLLAYHPGGAPVDARLRLLLGTGFLGAFTTFSTFEIDAQQMWATGEPGWAALYVVGSVVAGLVATLLGIALATAR